MGLKNLKDLRTFKGLTSSASEEENKEVEEIKNNLKNEEQERFSTAVNLEEQISYPKNEESGQLEATEGLEIPNSLDSSSKTANYLVEHEMNCKNPEKDLLESSSEDGRISPGEVMDITLKDIADVIELEERDEDLPAFTLRMCVLAMVLSTVIAGVDTFFAFRYPAISITAIVAQLVSFPLGSLWYHIIPSWRIPLGKLGGIELNPGRFNSKEHALIYIFTNTVVSTGLLRDTQVEQVKYFGIDVNIGRFILFNITGFLIAWGLAMLALPVLVDREELVWPSVLNSCALIKALHSRAKEPKTQYKMSRFGFFTWGFIGSFIWYWLSDLIVPFIAKLGAFPSWAKPKNAILGQVFGVSDGIGLLPITFDWTQISNISNPLTTPVWAAATIFGSFVFWVWIVLPGLYYQNWWQTAHLPLMSNQIYNKNGTTYEVKKVVTDEWTLDVDKYKKYSPVFLPIGFLLNLALSLSGFSSMMISFFWRFKKEVWIPLRNQRTSCGAMYLSASTIPARSIYVFFLLAGFAIGFAFVVGWDQSTQLSAGGYVVSIIIGVVLYVPVALIESKSTFTLDMDGFFNIISAFWFKGEPIASLYFLNFGDSVFQHAMHFTQGAKVGYYMGTPPRVTVFVLFAAGIWGSLVSASVAGFVLYHFPDFCSTDAKNNMTCKAIDTAFNKQIIWGLFGARLFGGGGRYNFIMYFFLAGGGLALVICIMQWKKPKSGFWQKLSPALIMSGAEEIPTMTGIHYGSWFVVVITFNFIIHRNYPVWWRKYNMILAAALDCGVAIAAIIIYFAISYTGASYNYTWWGTTVASSSCDSKGCPYKPLTDITAPTGLW